ncbi:flavocytochrome c [uncultured Anaerococcus sp.]|uniref:flavocytochrome c n=1 Tax=uncultured Anaerococcus sp. TaxID=293428 RepID=UPI00260C391F|nr:flavocytochrome c [uncultured Anaerococcus sp.]
MKKYLSIPLLLSLGLSLGACDSSKDAKLSENNSATTETTEEASEDKKVDYTEISGNYSGKATGYASDINVDVTIEDGEIKDITADQKETAAVGAQAIDKLRDKVISQNTTDLDTVSGATISSAAYLSAINKALESAGIEADKLASKDAEEDIKTSYDTDVVIVGAGGAGLSSAIELAQNGEKVLVVEKAGISGGNTSYASAGMNAAETKLQAEKNVPDTVELFIKDTMEGGKNLNKEELVEILASQSSDAIDWLEENDVKFNQLKLSGGQSEMRTHAPTDEEGNSIPVGSYLVDKLTKKAIEEGVDIIYDTEVDEILMEDGRAVGVKGKNDDQEITVNANAVIVASGGFGANMDRITEYRPDLEGYVSTNAKSIQGDAIDFLKDIDANFIDMDQIQIHPTVVQKNGSLISEGLRGEGAILVNNSGKRFFNELETRDKVSEAILDQEGSNAWLIVDQKMMDQSSTIQKYFDQDYLQKAEDYKQLAEIIGCDEDAITETLEDWQKITADNEDPDFNREGMDTSNSDLSTAPFYAVQVSPGIHHTMGGVEVNTNSEVLNSESENIPGLYAAGEVTGGVHGANRLGGNAVTDIVVFGRNSAKNADSYIKEK